VYFFAPYYFLAVLALFAHLGCAISWHVRPTPRARALVLASALCVGAVMSTLVLAALMGKLYPYEVPPKYQSTYVQSGPKESPR
jgi:hypothetical protein